ncbi:MAG: RhuM family protein [Campylobacterota bacterium]|nr:RhuM family protein [Campylobacterota bacterium]
MEIKELQSTEKTENLLEETIVVYSNGEIELNVSVEEDTIWLTQKQITELFDVTKQNISLHINNIFKEEELNTISVVKDYLTTAKDGKRYKTKHYNLDMIISIGYRVNSVKATKFRQWATGVLKQYISDGYVINHDKITHQRFKELENDVSILKKSVNNISKLIKNDTIKIEEGIFYNGEVYDAYTFISDLLKSAKKSIILIDNYIDDTVLTMLAKNQNIAYTIYTNNISKQLKLDIEKYNQQYANLKVKITKSYHDRFIIIDDIEMYNIGASFKDVGKKIFSINRMDRSLLQLDNQIK